MNNYDGKKISFNDVCKYIEKKNDNKLNEAFRHLFTRGVFFLPLIFNKYRGISNIISELATGATLAGKGICDIIKELLCDFFEKDNDYQDTYMRFYAAYYMCFYAAFFEAIDENIKFEYDDSFISSFNPREPDVMLLDDDGSIVSFRSVESIRQGYSDLSKQFYKYFLELYYVKTLVSEDKVQHEYYDNVIHNLPMIAVEKYVQQITQIAIKYPPFNTWLSVSFQLNIKNQISELPSGIAGKVSERVVQDLERADCLKKELRNQQKENYFYLFGDRQCEVEDVFTLSNYQFAGIEDQDPKEKIDSTQKILELIKRQRYLLITGPYGSGKTTLIKRIYLEYLRSDKKVYAFDAIDLFELSSIGKQSDFSNFFGALCDEGETIFLIDGLDDLNVPSSVGSENSRLIYFIINMFKFLKDRKNVFFVIASRQHAYIHDNQEETVANKVFAYSPEGTEMKMVQSNYFSPEDVYQWIENYPFRKGRYLNKKIIKEENKKIVNAFKNPLFLYAFIKQYEFTGEIKQHEGYYYYYESFINQTIQGKYRDEALEGAQVVSEYGDRYRDLIQKIAYDILKKHSSRIRSIVNPVEITEEQPLLWDRLQEFRYDITFDEFSEATKSCFNELKSEKMEKANFLNCYFLKVVDNTVFFTDVNILFTLASERIFLQLKSLSKREDFDLTHLDKLDVVDFYPQIVDYVIYKLREKNDGSFRKYLRSFVLNSDIRNRIDVNGKTKKELCETFAQILMLYILFFKNNKNSLSSDYRHVFKEMMYYANAYKSFSYKEEQKYSIYTIERYLIRCTLKQIFLKRVNLKHFNFSNSIIENSTFWQCKLSDTTFYNTEVIGKVLFDLCELKNAELTFKKSTEQEIVSFRDCRINKMNFKAQKQCHFIRCFIEELTIDPCDIEEVFFEKCVIEKVFFMGQKSRNNANIIFDACTFSTDINCSGYEGTISIKTKCINLKGSNIFKNINDNRIDDSTKLV